MNRSHTVILTLITLASAQPANAQSNPKQALTRLLQTVLEKSRATDGNYPQLAVPLNYESAAGPAEPGDLNDPRNFDVAGVRLAMTQAEAESALRTAGYIDTGIESDQDSYASEVRKEWSRRYDKPYPKTVFIPKDRYWKKGKQQVQLTFLALPEGARVSEISYTTEDSNLSSEAFAAQVQQKYGHPSNEDTTEMRWCKVKAPECEDGNYATLPLLTALTGNRSLTLTGNDEGRAKALDARKVADIESRKPAEAAASF